MADNLRDLIGKIKPFLRQYLQMNGVKIRADGKFLCPSPEKHDSVPSANFVPGSNDTQIHCHGCGKSADVYTVANWVEGLPLKGQAFVHKTVYGLARRFGVPFEPQEISEKDTEILHLQQIYEDAFSALRCFWKNRQHIKARGWPDTLCYAMGVATVTSWKDFLARLQSIRNYSKSELDRAGIKQKYFHEEAITFTLFDEYGSPVGFAMRDMRYEKADGVPKYMNTHSNLVYDKRRVVYGLHRARQVQGSTNVVEGYADVMSAFTFGLWNTVAICGSKPTPEQILGLETGGKRDLTLALDHDIKPMRDGRPTGQARTEDFIKEYVKGRRGVRIRIVDWVAASPNGKMDLDTFLMELHRKGLSNEEVMRSWDNLPKIDSFDWQMKVLNSSLPEDVVVERMLPIVAAEPVHARQEMLLRRLAERTDIRIEALQRDLDAALDLRARETRDQISRITKRAYADAQLATPEESAQILKEAHAKVAGIVDGVGTSKLGAGSSLDRVQEALSSFESGSTDMIGLKTGFPVFDKYMSGLCPGMWIWGGFPNVGKSSGLAQLSYSASCLNPDAINLVMTLDDSLEEWIAKYIALQTSFPIGHVVHVKRWILPDPKKVEIYNQARDNVLRLMSEGRLEVRDATMGSNTSAAERWVDQVRKRNPDKKIALWLDNFHCLSDHGPDPRTRFSDASKRLKLLSRVRNCFIGMTAELTKNDNRERPTKKMLKETGTLEYDATGIIMVHNPLDVDPSTLDAWDDPQASDPTLSRKPILYWYVDKNKNLYGVYKGVVRLRFNNECSQVSQIETPAPSTARQESKARPPSGINWE